MLTDASVAALADAGKSHQLPLPYDALVSTRVSLFRPSECERLCWNVLAAHRSYCRLRAGLVDLVHVNKRRSTASIRLCVFCGKKVRTSFMHALGECDISQHPSLPAAWEQMSMADS